MISIIPLSWAGETKTVGYGLYMKFIKSEMIKLGFENQNDTK